MSRDAEHAYDVGSDWLEDTIRERRRGDEEPVCARCGAVSEWRDEDTGELLCDRCAR